MNTICYYHKTLDGKCSAAIVRRKYPDCELIGVDYLDRPDMRQVEGAEKIIIVDFCFKTSVMDWLLGFFGGHNIVWIDHHKTAIEKADKYFLDDRGTSLGSALAGKREIGKSSRELTWEYLFLDEPMPPLDFNL